MSGPKPDARGLSLGLYEKAMPASLSWPEKMAAARDAGFNCLEMSIDETDGKLSRLWMDGGALSALRQAAGSEGVPIKSICLSGHRRYPLGSRDAARRARGREMLSRAIELAFQLGVRVIQLAGYDVY
ncbi:MAG: TIM barrel protein, partial [Clostridia bacterium]|nr:TIM barrel protein [Clostridia bacterium]